MEPNNMFRSQDDWLAEIYKVIGRSPPSKRVETDKEIIKQLAAALKKERIKNILLGRKKKSKKPTEIKGEKDT